MINDFLIVAVGAMFGFAAAVILAAIVHRPSLEHCIQTAGPGYRCIIAAQPVLIEVR